jgi:hypothetical protein
MKKRVNAIHTVTRTDPVPNDTVMPPPDYSGGMCLSESSVTTTICRFGVHCHPPTAKDARVDISWKSPKPNLEGEQYALTNPDGLTAIGCGCAVARGAIQFAAFISLSSIIIIDGIQLPRVSLHGII